MGLFNRKGKGVVDLTEYHRKQQEKIADIKQSVASAPKESATESGFSFFSSMANAGTSTNNSYPTLSDNATSSDSDEKRRRLAKRLSDMTDKLEEISNQLYHLQQRVEVLERKGGMGVF